MNTDYKLHMLDNRSTIPSLMMKLALILLPLDLINAGSKKGSPPSVLARTAGVLICMPLQFFAKRPASPSMFRPFKSHALDSISGGALEE